MLTGDGSHLQFIFVSIDDNCGDLLVEEHEDGGEHSR